MKLQILRFTFFLLMYLTLPLIAMAQVVDIPDPNLRAAIEAELGKASGAPITVDEMATLPRLEAPEADISNLIGLEHAINLKKLNLWGNSVKDLSPLVGLTNLESLFLDANGISNLSPLAGLTKLTRLALSNNSVSDLSPLAGLTSLRWMRLAGNNISDLSPLVTNTGLGDGDELEIQGNPLNYTSIKTHIPALKNRGVTVEFDDVTHLNFGEPHMVRLIYFLPSDRSPQQNIDTKLDTLIRDVQQFYADEMEHYNFGRKTFTFETDATGKAVVHHVDGQFTDSYYRQNSFHKVWDEIREQFYTPQNIYFIVIDSGSERVGRGYNEVCSVGDSHEASGGHVLIPASGDCFNLKTAAHELGHAFGLEHDFRSDAYIMSFGRDPDKLSECAAEWLEAHRYFNIDQSQTHFDNPTRIQMLPPLASSPYAIRFRFEVTDPDGVHQVQLLTPATIRNQGPGQSKLLSCKRLNGETDTIEIELITNQLTVNSEHFRDGVSEAVPLSVEVILRVIDVYGNVTLQTYLIDITTILLTGTVSTPYTNQAINISEPVPPPSTIREAFELSLFYQQWVDVEGLPVVASEKVNPYALKEAAWLIWQMIGHRPEILHVLVQKRVRFVVIGHTEITTDIPEYSDQGPDFLVYRFRGLGGGGLSGHIAVSSSEENLLHYPGTFGLYNVMLHEFAHAIHRFGLNTVDPTFDNRLQIAYAAAIEKGLWQGTYASSNRGEYWAEATQAWFYPKGASSFKGNTRQVLKNYDPGLAALLAEIYGDSEWRYTPLATRTHLPHLQGFDPQDSPTFQGWPELEAVYRQLSNPDSDGGGRWVDLRPYDPSLLPSLSESRTAGPRTTVAFVNLTRSYVLVYPVGYDGTPEFSAQLPPGYIRVTPAIVNEIWLIKDLNGRNLAVFQALEKTGRILIDEAPILITPGLSKISGDNQTSVSGAALSNPFVIEVRDENGSALEGISITFTVTAGDGTLSTTRTTTDTNGRAQSILTLGPNIGTQTVSVSAARIEHLVTFNAMVEAAVDLPDTNLRAAVETALRKAGGDPIIPSEMATLTHLEEPEAGIHDLTGLEHATNLTYLDFWNSAVLDLSPVAGLTNLTHLGFAANNAISDVSALVGLTNLTAMWLNGNSISDLSPLVANTGLGSGDTVNVKGNPLSYLSIHTHLPTLQSRGVTVEFDNQAHPALLKISGDNQKGASFTPLSQPCVVEAQDTNGSSLVGVSVTFAVVAGGGTLSSTSTRTNENGRAQSTLTLGPNLGTNTVEVSATGIESTVTFHAISDTELPPITADVNSDGSVNILDLILIASDLGNTGTNLVADINGDGVVSILDLVLAAGMFDGAAAAPSAQPQVPETLTAVEVQGWLTDARALEVRDPTVKRGFVVLEQLLVSLTPKETELLANYPNPFNPETWIPYRLAEDANVTLTIYDSSGQVIRTLDVGHRIASTYENRSKAIYWDGRNGLGERVASSVYFYTLTTGDFSATRRMVILK